MDTTAFSNPRYVTQGIMHAVPMEIQLILWNLIDQKKNRKEPLDYLQIFEISPMMQSSNLHQKIVHRQEVPPSSKKILLSGIAEPIKLKVWIIDDGDHSTMILPEEY